MERRLKVLMSAYACEPGKGSEPAVGWNVALHLQRWCDVHVITRANNQPAIESYESQHGKSGVTWIYYDSHQWFLSLKRRFGFVWPYYLIWQIGVLPHCKQLHSAHKFDLVHHLTYGSLFLPTFLHRVNAPLIWGPIGGAFLKGTQFVRNFSLRGRILEAFRSVLTSAGLVRLLHKRTLQKAARVLVVSKESQHVLRLPTKQCEVVSQVGIREEEFRHLTALPDKNPSKRILMAGRLVHWKGFAIGIKAFGKCQALHPDSTLTILGSGSEEQFLRRLARRKGVVDKVQFVGHVTREKYFGHLAECDIFLFPSSHEPGAYVIIEAMAAGKPVICTDFGEPAMLVSGGCGILVDPNHPAGIVQGFADALNWAFLNPKQAQTMGSIGRQKVNAQLSWEKKASQIASVYSHVLGNEN